MNRLERGAYHDMVISQRKFGHLSLDQVKKIIGRDFAECWPAIELIMKVDAEGKFFIEWLDTSIEKMRSQSKHQSENGRKGGRPKANDNPNKSQLQPKQNPTLNQKKPLEDGYGNGDESKLKNKKESKNDSRETEQAGPKPLSDDMFEPLTDEWFAYIFDEMEVERKKMAYRDHDIDDQLIKFKSKVRGSPADYIYRDTAGVRSAFDYHLRNSKPQKAKEINGKPKASLDEIRKFSKGNV
jgi:hypothetical protein